MTAFLDGAGHPYLEWNRIKPPRGRQSPPIHQETHDLIRQWQQVKKRTRHQLGVAVSLEELAQARRPLRRPIS